MRRGLLAVLLAASLSGGCGGTAPASTRLHDQATRICAPADQQLGRLATPRAGPGDQAFLSRGISVLDRELAGLRRLHPNGDDRPVYAIAVAGLAQEIAELRATLLALNRHQDPALAFPALQRRLAPLETRANAAWQALQIPACLNR